MGAQPGDVAYSGDLAYSGSSRILSSTAEQHTYGYQQGRLSDTLM